MMDTQEAARLEVAAALPEAIGRALDSYLAFSRGQPPKEPREHAQFQTACKNALAHLDALLRLAQALQPSATGEAPATSPDGAAELKALLRQARAAVSGLASPPNASPPSASPASRSSSGSGPAPRG